MTTIQRAPRDITPRDFFESWLPKEYDRLEASIRPAPPNIKAQVQLDGDGGGTWLLELAGGALSVSNRTVPDADIAMAMSVADWRAITVGEDGPGLDLAPPEGMSPGSVGNWFVNPTIHQALASIKGTLRFEIPGFRGRTFAIALTFHGAAQPQATISVDAETVAAIRSGALPAPQAFFAGKILLSGDTAFAMQVAMTVMAQAQQR
jgi:putative sterol carrier protein